ncbi:hypothetical protein GCM10023191_040340 [Actinoallomurus oryzae]|uniref:Uncharacterized protein n=1 Tax=Actinoallomurus oryzae TaxID=502180 RepID=A0ABP8Q6Y2_9ACTN
MSQARGQLVAGTTRLPAPVKVGTCTVWPTAGALPTFTGFCPHAVSVARPPAANAVAAAHFRVFPPRMNVSV